MHPRRHGSRPRVQLLQTALAASNHDCLSASACVNAIFRLSFLASVTLPFELQVVLKMGQIVVEDVNIKVGPDNPRCSSFAPSHGLGAYHVDTTWTSLFPLRIRQSTSRNLVSVTRLPRPCNALSTPGVRDCWLCNITDEGSLTAAQTRHNKPVREGEAGTITEKESPFTTPTPCCTPGKTRSPAGSATGTHPPPYDPFTSTCFLFATPAMDFTA